jgi:hypothetical protein
MKSPEDGAGSPVGRSKSHRATRPKQPIDNTKKARRMLATIPLDLLDKRSAVGVAARKRREELVAQYGGDVSPAQDVLIESAIKTELIVRAAEDYILRQATLVVDGELLPVVMQRQALVDSLARLLHTLGLRRVAKPVPHLGDYLAAKVDTKAPATEAAVHPPAPAPGTTETPFTTEAGDRMKKEGPGAGSVKSVGAPPGDGNSGVSVVPSRTTP